MFVCSGVLGLRYSKQFALNLYGRQTEPSSTRPPWRGEDFPCRPWQGIPEYVRLLRISKSQNKSQTQTPTVTTVPRLRHRLRGVVCGHDKYWVWMVMCGHDKKWLWKVACKREKSCKFTAAIYGRMNASGIMKIRGRYAVRDRQGKSSPRHGRRVEDGSVRLPANNSMGLLSIA